MRCLGPLEAAWDDDPALSWPSRRGKTLFKYLVLHRGRPTLRDVLMDLLWPHAAPSLARNNLNVTMSGLRRSLAAGTGGPCVRFLQDSYLLDPELSIWVDVEEFARLLAVARRCAGAGDRPGFLRAARAADSLYRGDLFDDDPHGEWVQEPRRALREDHLEVLDELGQCYLEGNDHPACLRTCHAILAAEPERESVHRRLMRCYARQSRRHLALRQYDRCESALRNGLGTPPEGETLHLVEQIRRGLHV